MPKQSKPEKPDFILPTDNGPIPLTKVKKQMVSAVHLCIGDNYRELVWAKEWEDYWEILSGSMAGSKTKTSTLGKTKGKRSKTQTNVDKEINLSELVFKMV